MAKPEPPFWPETLFAVLETIIGTEVISKLGAIEGLVVEPIPGGLKSICDGSFVSISEKVELGAVAKIGPETGKELCFDRGTLVMLLSTGEGVEVIAGVGILFSFD